MERWLNRFSEPIYFLLRTMSGMLFLCHGAQKLFGAWGGRAGPSDPLMVVAGIIELVGGGLIALGLYAGFAAFIASGQMAVAYFMAHASRGFVPIVNKGELAVLYCFVFLYIASRGSGLISVDRLIASAQKPN